MHAVKTPNFVNGERSGEMNPGVIWQRHVRTVRLGDKQLDDGSKSKTTPVAEAGTRLYK